jgi:flagellar hook-basal body complex protein FliE
MIDALSFLSPLTQTVGDISGNALSVLPGATTTTTTGSSADFGSMLSQLTDGAMSTLKAGEASAISGIEGKTPVQDVVNSVLDAQGALQTVLAIRDKVVSAYQEVSRMAI